MNRLVSVVIPSKDRAYCLPRTIGAVQKQAEVKTEIIVVDDGSTDETPTLLQNEYPEVVYLRNDVAQGGAIARNQGAAVAKGDYIAFLDSDDEWETHHLAHKIALIQQEDAGGAYGNFLLSYDQKYIRDPKLVPRKADQSMADYIFSGVGDARTSTFVFRKSAFDSIRFDESLLKHQDWDFAIRFAEAYPFLFESQKDAILHVSSEDRMSFRLHHPSTKIFLKKHQEAMGKARLSQFCFNMALRCLLKREKRADLLFYVTLGKENTAKKSLQYLKFLVIEYRLVNLRLLYVLYNRLMLLKVKLFKPS